MTISTGDLIYDELKTNSALLRRLIEIQRANALVSLTIALSEEHITKELYDELGAMIDGNATLR